MNEIVVAISTTVLSATDEWCPRCLLPSAQRVIAVVSMDDLPQSVLEAVVCECSEDGDA
jgi:hypothetical protein